MAVHEEDWLYTFEYLEDGSTPEGSPFHNREVRMEIPQEEVNFLGADYRFVSPRPNIFLDGFQITFERFKELVDAHNKTVREVLKERELKDKLFEFKDLLCWFSENGYDISEIGGDSFAVTANYSRFDTGTTFHVGPGGVMQSVER